MAGGLPHTYVKCLSDGHIFYCYGEVDKCDANNPTIGCPVPGNYDHVRAIAATATCGLTYGIQGVCHQMTNRILYACQGDENQWRNGNKTDLITPDWHEGHPIVVVGNKWWFARYGPYGNQNNWINYKAQIGI